MFNAEIQKSIKKPPVVEFDIPKKIFFRAVPVEEELLTQENVLSSLWSFE